MKVSELKDGEIYWTCLPDMESEGHGDDYPKTPYRVQAKRQGKPRDDVVYLHCFDRETGEIDDDSNATAIAENNAVFATKEEAQKYYVRETVVCVEMLLNHAKNMLIGVRKNV